LREAAVIVARNLVGPFRTGITPAITPDATGGLGSFFGDVREILTGGLQAAVRGEVTRRYGPEAFQELPAVAAYGTVRPAGAPTPPPAVAEVWTDRLVAFAREQPLAVAAVIAVGGFLVFRLARG